MYSETESLKRGQNSKIKFYRAPKIYVINRKLRRPTNFNFWSGAQF